ncbi:MAG: histidinol-phosphate transaminase [Fimbriimonadaceae bacterium]|nr:histidinol-phosphate transaminase [Fimbriimonadaceae bacterium]
MASTPEWLGAIASAVKPQVHRLVPYVPGTPIIDVMAKYGLTDVVKLASNENPFGPAPAVIEAIRAAVPEIGLYPDAGAVELRQALATKHGVQSDQISVANGSDELLQTIGYAVLGEGDELLIGDPTFLRYEPQAILNRARTVKVPLRDDAHDLDAMLGRITDRTKCIMLCNPHNPAGTYLPDGAIEHFLEAVPKHVLVVLDEAYYEFVDHPDHGRSMALALGQPNVLVLRTFSKIHALAALRVGYAVGRPYLVRWIEQIREPFNVNSLAQVAALAALRDETHVQQTLLANRAGRELYTQTAARLGLRAVLSQANFVLFDLGRHEQPVYEALLRRGVIVRACSGMGLPGHLRVTIGTPEQCDRFVREFEVALSAPAGSG